MAILNEDLARKQKITQEQRDYLYKLYDYMDVLLQQAYHDENIEETGKDYADRMTVLENKLQTNWNFPIDKLKHTHWNKFSECSCPFYDNQERFGFEKIINCECPFHKHLCVEKPRVPLTPEEFKEAMIECKSDDDNEMAHINMDRIMVDLLEDLGYGAGITVFDEQPKWYT